LLLDVIRPIPEISAILPTYKRARVLGRAIKSVLDQTFQDFELIIIDDNSNDGTEELVKGFNSEKIRYYCQEAKTSPAKARNRGIQLALGKYIAFQDSDDQWMPNKLEKQFVELEKSPAEVGVCYCKCEIITKYMKSYLPQKWISPTEGKIFESLLKDSFIGPQVAMIKREGFERVGSFNEKFAVYEDYDLFLRLSKHYDFSYINEPLVTIYPQNDSISKNQIVMIACYRQILENYYQDINRDKKLLAIYHHRIGSGLCSNGKRKEGRKYLLKAFKSNPRDLELSLALFLSFFGNRIYTTVGNTYWQIKKLFQR
jgi:glycosyltransferase involved in cell wall biosynthesis